MTVICGSLGDVGGCNTEVESGGSAVEDSGQQCDGLRLYRALRVAVVCDEGGNGLMIIVEVVVWCTVKGCLVMACCPVFG